MDKQPKYSFHNVNEPKRLIKHLLPLLLAINRYKLEEVIKAK
jgi:hypothetical protein